MNISSQMGERWLLILAIAVTMGWLAIVGAYVHESGLQGILSLAPLQFAALLAGLAGPLVALWLMVAVFEQRREVTHLVKRLGQGLQQSEAQARALLQILAQAKNTQSNEARILALQDLAANAAVLAERLGVITRENLNAAWARYGSGDSTVFVQSFLAFAVTHPEITERLAEAVARDGVAHAALAGYVRRYEQLRADPASDKVTRDILEDGALGRAYRLFKNADDLAIGQQPESVAAEAELDSLSRRLEAAAPVGTE